MAYWYGFSYSSSDGNSTDSGVAGYRFQPQRQRPVLSDRPDVCVGEGTREIEMTRRETTSPETASTGVNVLSDLTMKTTASSRQSSPHLSYIHIHTQCYKIKSLALHNEENSQKQLDRRSQSNSGSSASETAVTVTSL